MAVTRECATRSNPHASTRCIVVRRNARHPIETMTSLGSTRVRPQLSRRRDHGADHPAWNPGRVWLWSSRGWCGWSNVARAGILAACSMLTRPRITWMLSGSRSAIWSRGGRRSGQNSSVGWRRGRPRLRRCTGVRSCSLCATASRVELTSSRTRFGRFAIAFLVHSAPRSSAETRATSTSLRRFTNDGSPRGFRRMEGCDCRRNPRRLRPGPHVGTCRLSFWPRWAS